MIDGKRLTEKRVVIETANLELIPCELKHFEAILTDQRQLGRCSVSSCSTTGSISPAWRASKPCNSCTNASKPPRTCLVGGRTFLHVEDKVLIGLGGFKGEANESGMVEIGYAIVPAYRGRGLATEAARGLVDHALHTRT